MKRREGFGHALAAVQADDLAGPESGELGDEEPHSHGDVNRLAEHVLSARASLRSAMRCSVCAAGR